jgi:hypothetical protein
LTRYHPRAYNRHHPGNLCHIVIGVAGAHNAAGAFSGYPLALPTMAREFVMVFLFFLGLSLDAL